VWYETTNVDPPVTGTGEERLTCCQPDDVSFEDQALAKRVPDELHTVTS